MEPCTDTPTVYVVDDDPSVRDSLRWLLESISLRTETYAGAEEFLDTATGGGIGCLLLDVRMPGLGGLEAQERLAARGITYPVIVITGHADVPMAIRAMKAGAFDFIEKPFDDERLLARVREALAAHRAMLSSEARREAIRERLERLTPREREILELVLAGRTNKQMAAELELSIKTVETHRARVMEKTGAASLPELTALVLAVAADAGNDGGADQGKPRWTRPAGDL